MTVALWTVVILVLARLYAWAMPLPGDQTERFEDGEIW